MAAAFLDGKGYSALQVVFIRHLEILSRNVVMTSIVIRDKFYDIDWSLACGFSFCCSRESQ